MNNYILEYYQAMTDGRIVVGEKIKRWYEIIVKSLQKKAFLFDAKKANKAIRFIQEFCRHCEGELAPNHIKLELWQKAFLSVIFGCVDEDGTRHFREVLLIVGRKNGKTLLASAIASYMAFLDGEYGAKIYFVAPKLLQANICFDAFYQMVEKESDLSSLARKRRTDIYIASTNTSIQPLPFSSKKSDGLNPHFCSLDEISSWQGDAGLKQYEVLKSALGSRKQPLLLAYSSSGYQNDGIYDELVKRSTAVLNGDSRESRLAPFIYAIDDISKWNDINELQKANPNLNVSISVDYLLEEIAIAEGSLSKKAEFLTKYCNVKQNSSQAWLNAEDVIKATGSYKLEDFTDCYAVGGIDLSRTTDLTSCCVVIQKKGQLYVFTKSFLPAEKIDEAIARDGLPYKIYIQRGLLQPSGANFVDYKDCFNWFTELVEQYRILPLKIGYDRYSSTYLVQQLNDYGFHTDDVYTMGTNMTGAIRECEGLLKDGKLHIGDNDLLKVHLLDTALKVDAESDKCQIIKLHRNAHIDNTASLLCALIVRQKWWGEIGGRLLNE